MIYIGYVHFLLVVCSKNVFNREKSPNFMRFLHQMPKTDNKGKE
jgi:hypothetical protein